MTLQELQNRVPEYRVIRNSGSSDSAVAQDIKEQMVGRTYKAQRIDFERGTVKLDGCWFKFSDVQELALGISLD